MRTPFKLTLLAPLLFFAACMGKGEQRVGTEDVPLPTDELAPPAADEDVPVGPGEVAPPAFSPAPAHARTLLGWQYKNAIRELISTSAAVAAMAPPDSTVQGLDAIGA